MNDFFRFLQNAFPSLKDHPRLVLILFFLALFLALLYRAKDRRKQICNSLLSKFEHRIFATNRWLYVYRDSQVINDWKYYTSEVTGNGNVGDDVIWTLVNWPSLKPIDSFRVHGAVGMVSGIHESQVKLQARWNISHDPDVSSIGPVPALGMKSKLRRAMAKLTYIAGSI